RRPVADLLPLIAGVENQGAATVRLADRQGVHELSTGWAEHLDVVRPAGAEAPRYRDRPGLRLTAADRHLLGVQDGEAQRAAALGGGNRHLVIAILVRREGVVIDVGGRVQRQAAQADAVGAAEIGGR